MAQVNYIHERDELEVVFKEVDIPEVVKLSSGITFEFGPNELSAIILPNFGQMIHVQGLEHSSLKFESLDQDSLKVKFNEQIVNIKLDLSELEK